MKVSVIIPCRNCAATLPAQLESLRGQSWSDGWEIIVADNDSSDRTFSVARKFKRSIGNLRLLRATARRGYAYARNAAAAIASGDVLLFCDGNDLVPGTWLQAMGNALRSEPFVAGRLIVTEINPPWAMHARADAFFFHEAAVSTALGNLPWASASNMGIRREVLLEVGGFNENLRALEDIELCWRFQRQFGLEPAPVPESFVHYRLRKTLPGLFHQAFLQGQSFRRLRRDLRSAGFAPDTLPASDQLREVVLLSLRLLRFQRKDFGAWLWCLGWLIGSRRGPLIQHNAADPVLPPESGSARTIQQARKPVIGRALRNPSH